MDLAHKDELGEDFPAHRPITALWFLESMILSPKMRYVSLEKEV
jgi:hypothetical protein